MRRKYLIAAGAAIMLAAGGTFAFADPNDTAPTVADRTGATVTLPTGDDVIVSDGTLIWRPAEGREGISHVRLSPHDGSRDIIAIPKDRLDDIAAGEEDARRYNVSELLRNGETNAAKATDLSGKSYGRFVPSGGEPRSAADKQDVTFTVTDHSGKPVAAVVSYVDPKTGDGGEVEVDSDGKGKVSLPPGQYDFLSMTMSQKETVLGINTVAVDAEPVAFDVDGTKGQEITYKVDRPAELVEQSIGIFSGAAGENGYGMGTDAYPDLPGYVIPADKVDHPTGIEVTPDLAGGDDGDRYTYDLHFLQDGGIPDKPTFTAHDEELAQVAQNFDGIATETPTTHCNIGVHEDGSPIAGCTLRDVSWQSQRTEFFTAGPKLTWYSDTYVGDPFESHSVAISSASRFEPGKTEHTIGHAPLSFNLNAPANSDGIVVGRKGDKLSGYLPYLENADPNESVNADMPVTGEVVLKRDGEEIGRKELKSAAFSFTLPDKDSGHYTLSAALKHDEKLTPLATETSVAWEFDSKPTDKVTPLDVSAVAFDAEGVSNGYAEVGEEQEFTLDYRAQNGAADTNLKDLTFEVSYDDGKTWQKVDVAVDGDKATGTLKHPDGAKFVSVKATATDDAGNKVTHSTIHAYGLG